MSSGEGGISSIVHIIGGHWGAPTLHFDSEYDLRMGFNHYDIENNNTTNIFM